MKILIMGLPGSGKTALARALASKIRAVHWNADEVRTNINKDLGFSINDRIEQARRMGWLSSQVSVSGYPVIADFVCPLPETRAAFNADYTIYMHTIRAGRFDDTNSIFVEPLASEVDYTVLNFDAPFHSDILSCELIKRINNGP